MSEPFVSPLLAGPPFCPDPSPSPLPAAYGWVALAPQGALRVEGSSGHACPPGSPGQIGLRLIAPLPPRTPSPPRTPCTTPRGAHPRLGCMQGGENRGSRDPGVPQRASLFSKPKGGLRPAPFQPLPGALATASLRRLATSGSAHRGVRFFLRHLVSGCGDKPGVGGGCRSPGREGVARGGSRCPAGPDLLLGRCAPDSRGSRDWRLEAVRHFRPESPGRGVGIWPSQASGFQAMAEDVPLGAQMAGDEAAKLCALARRSTPALGAQLYLFSPLTFLLRALGDGLCSPCPGACPGPAATLDP